jgi:HAMP domain-containing protein
VIATESGGGRGGLTLKIFAAMAGVVVAVLGVALLLTSVRASQSATAAIDRQLANTGGVARQLLAAEKAKLASGAKIAARNPNFIAAVAGDSSAVFDLATTYNEILEADYTLITDSAGVLKVRTDRPGVSGDTLGGPLIAQALEGRLVAGFVNEADQRLYLAVAIPLADLASGVVQGVLFAAHQVTDSLAAEVKLSSGSQIVFYLLDRLDHPVVVASTVPKSPELDSAVAAAVRGQRTDSGRVEARFETRMGGTALVGFSRPLANPGVNHPLGGYFALRSLAAEQAGFSALQRTLVVVAIVGLLLALAASWLVANRISRPVRALVDVTRRVAEGDYGATVEITSRDEIGELAGSFRKMVEELRAKQALVEYMGASSEAAPQVHTDGDVGSPTMTRLVAADSGSQQVVEGQTLKHLIRSRGPLPVHAVLTVGKQLCRALEVAHEQGVIHRDIKPQNIVVGPGGMLKLTDFGIAQLATPGDDATEAGMAIGTPEYMAPEQLLGGALDLRVDLYAAGCVLFECLTGRTPFVADSPITLVAKQLEEVPPSPSSLNREVPESLAQLILRTLSKDPARRPQSAAALHDELDAITT